MFYTTEITDSLPANLPDGRGSIIVLERETEDGRKKYSWRMFGDSGDEGALIAKTMKEAVDEALVDALDWLDEFGS